MSVHVTIEASSRAEAELIAQCLPVDARVHAWRGLGVIRLVLRSHEETNALIEAVGRSFHELRLRWARVRYDDEERVFRSNGRRPI